MEKEKYLGEALLKDTSKKKLNLKIRDGSVTLEKLDPSLRNSIADGNYMQAITSDEIDTLWEQQDDSNSKGNDMNIEIEETE